MSSYDALNDFFLTVSDRVSVVRNMSFSDLIINGALFFRARGLTIEHLSFTNVYFNQTSMDELAFRVKNSDLTGSITFTRCTFTCEGVSYGSSFAMLELEQTWDPVAKRYLGEIIFDLLTFEQPHTHRDWDVLTVDMIGTSNVVIINSVISNTALFAFYHAYNVSIINTVFNDSGATFVTSSPILLSSLRVAGSPIVDLTSATSETFFMFYESHNRSQNTATVRIENCNFADIKNTRSSWNAKYEEGGVILVPPSYQVGRFFSKFEVHNCKFHRIDVGIYAIKNMDERQAIDATRNWWDSAAGPADRPGRCNPTSGPKVVRLYWNRNSWTSHITYNPWCTDKLCSQLRHPIPLFHDAMCYTLNGEERWKLGGILMGAAVAWMLGLVSFGWYKIKRKGLDTLVEQQRSEHLFGLLSNKEATTRNNDAQAKATLAESDAKEAEGYALAKLEEAKRATSLAADLINRKDVSDRAKLQALTDQTAADGIAAEAAFDANKLRCYAHDARQQAEVARADLERAEEWGRSRHWDLFMSSRAMSRGAVHLSDLKKLNIPHIEWKDMDVKLNQSLATGAHGCIHPATFPSNCVSSLAKNTNTTVRGAIKLPKRISAPSSNDLKFEAYLLHGLRHPNLVPFFGFTRHENTFGLVMLEMRRYMFIPGQSSAYYLSIVSQLATVMAHLASHRVAHGDLKPGNLLFYPSWKPPRPGKTAQIPTVAIADFGFSHYIPPGSTSVQTQFHGTHGYLCPELDREGVLSESRDVYAFGVTVYEIHLGKLYDPRERATLTNIVALSIYARNLVFLCTDPDPDRRPSFAQICEFLRTVPNPTSSSSSPHEIPTTLETVQEDEEDEEADENGEVKPMDSYLDEITGLTSSPPATRASLSGLTSAASSSAPPPSNLNGNSSTDPSSSKPAF